ncbi:MAG TPA: hypothetical protein VH138_07800, partial [Vicinamibacterales bacterium]|nr:hypothetical protein [Vicinamibacterales bacterium]
MRRLWVAGCTFVAASAVLQAGAVTGSAGWPSSRVLSRAEQPLRSYTAFRRMHAYSEDQKHEAWMEAWTELENGQFSYTIVSETGSETIRGRVLRAVLARERDMVSKGETGRADLTAENYEFTEAGRDETGARVVQIKPRRADVMLVDGRAVLSDSGDLLRVEGTLSKNPSFWTSLVNIVRHYARIGGIRVPVATETTAKVKFVGNSQLDVFYDYE